jgi:hypothetical protein
MKRLAAVLFFSTCLSLGAAHAGSPVRWSGQGQATYTVIHKFHEVKGTSRFLVVKAVMDDQGLQFTARALVSSFDSGNANRDAHAMEVVDPAHFPYVTVKGAQRGFKLPAPGAKTQVTLTAEVDLHGVEVTHPIKVTVETKDPTHVKIAFQFSESFTAHKMERPSLMFIAVDDAIRIEGKAALEAMR